MLAVAALAAVAALGASSGCVTSNAQPCNDLICPSGMMCSPTGDRCVDTDLVLACRAAEDEDSCTVAGMPPAKCRGGVCQASRCGDGRLTGAEECDGKAMGTTTCQMLGFYDQPGLRCSADCRYDTTMCTGRCGDGVKNGTEQCDSQDLGGASCFTAGFYKAAGLACNDKCEFDTAQCSGGRCGDGVLNGLEQCDGKALSRTCKQLGFDFTLTGMQCTSSCTFSTKSCLCARGERCATTTQRCEVTKYGAGCVNIRQ